MYICLLQIMTDETEKCSNELQRTAFCQPNIDVSNFLNLNSLTNHDAFCLAYIFTYRDFSHGTLGLAWVGSPTGNTSFQWCSFHVTSMLELCWIDVKNYDFKNY